ncbi:MAG: GGDEF and EAL domain-containing protein [Lachnospiraceae bacterium]|nr:GGDEF and EAL domain-containing protein [Lachnospiraceae bacterium]
MDKFSFTDEKRKFLEESEIPYVIYQFIDKRIVTVLVSKGMCDLMGATREDISYLMDNDMYRYAHPEDVARVADASYRFASGKEDSYDIVYRTKSHKTGEYVFIHSNGKAFFEDGVRLCITWYMIENIIYDEEKTVGELFQKNLNGLLGQEKLIIGNYYDTLTGIPNMSYFISLATEGVRSIFASGKVPAMLYFDLSGMKFYNEKYGMAEGDKLLILLARILKRHFSTENCGRLGQDRFAVYTPNENLVKELKSVFKELREEDDEKAPPLRVGIYIYSEEDRDIDPSLACDKAKMAGDQEKSAYVSSYYYYNEKIKIMSQGKDYVLHNFRRALDEDWIKPYYQPIIRTVNGKMSDAEALARWDDPEKGIISPELFVPVLEDAKLIHRLDLYMVEKVLQDINRNRSMGAIVFPVSVNLSRYDFILCDMVSEICELADKYNVDSNILTFEVTESVAGLDPYFLQKQIKRFHEAGFKVWMDDFGSGYSSLNILQYFEFDLIKFDMKFLQDFESSKKNHILLTELIQMVNKLGIDTIAEGVETEEQAKFLKEIGCDKVQGFYFSEPLTADELLKICFKEPMAGHEKLLEADYYNVVSRTSLRDPKENGYYGLAVNEYFNAIPMGVIEVKGGDYYILRYNRSYVEFLLRTNFIDAEPVFGNELKALRKPEPNFCATVEAAITSSEWLPLEKSTEEGITSNVFLRKLAINPVTGGVAVLVVVLMTTK